MATTKKKTTRTSSAKRNKKPAIKARKTTLARARKAAVKRAPASAKKAVARKATVTKKAAARKAPVTKKRGVSKTSAAAPIRRDISYNPQVLEPKWQARWAADKLYRSVIDESRPKHYALTMLPYPSGD